MTPIKKPYFRIFRPFISKKYLDYAEDDRYCPERVQLIRMYKMLQMQVIDTFQYVEPVEVNLEVFSLRYHQLFSNICAEIETNFRGILKANGYTRGKEEVWNMSDDFFKTNLALKLHEYIIRSSIYEKIYSTDIGQPFAIWNTQVYCPLDWYKEHNGVKHDRSTDFKKANLKNVLTALTGLYILLYAQFGFLVEIITNKNWGADFLTPHPESKSKNEMGFCFKQQPVWNDDEKYEFEWGTLINNSPYEKYPFKMLNS